MTSLDAALSELGMLSSVPDVRRQYIRECAARIAARNIQAGRERLNSEPSSLGNISLPAQGTQEENMQPQRERKNSEPPCTTQITMSPPRPSSLTPNNSPSKGFHVLHINPAFVTNLMVSPGDATRQSKTELGGTRSRVGPIVRDKHCLLAGDRFHQEDGGEMVCRRVKLSRHAKRFRKPYELPWLQRRVSQFSQGDVCNAPHLGEYSQVNLHMTSSPIMNPSEISQTRSVGAAGDMVNSSKDPNFQLQLQSKSSSPELQSSAQCHIQVKAQVHHISPCDITTPGELLLHSVPRSKSLDHLDFAQFQVAEQENQNYWMERREIDTVSRHMQNLNVSE